MSSPVVPHKKKRPTYEIIAELACVLARARAAADHAQEVEGEVPCASQSIAAIVPTSKTRGR